MVTLRAPGREPGHTSAIVRLIYESDVRAVLPAIRVPTLVIHRADATGFTVEHGRYLAAHIPGAEYVELPGIDNLIWAGDQDAIVAEIQAFVTGVRPAPSPTACSRPSCSRTSSARPRRAAELGDGRWRGLLAEHDRRGPASLERFGGREVKTTGDGFLATFDGPARAVRCALAIRDGVRELGLEVRAGLHTGEIEVRPDDIAGLAVHIGARISALAGAGRGPRLGHGQGPRGRVGLAFEDRGSHVLKGVPGEWRTYLLEGG